ncbi:rho gtpase activation protein [Anaeramoeba ignava]|uniref:Rho gtpase activation protein n=1 Tax=Anaeramoeba ignava TaxID=1746090 RepID=A0A9Q0LGA2_ANAIG|nr:rho gtpase activation protein [Anaeramoeba ignava]
MSEWSEHIDPSSNRIYYYNSRTGQRKKYYYNHKTGASVWTKPKELEEQKETKKTENIENFGNQSIDLPPILNEDLPPPILNDDIQLPSLDMDLPPPIFDGDMPPPVFDGDLPPPILDENFSIPQIESIPNNNFDQQLNQIPPPINTSPNITKSPSPTKERKWPPCFGYHEIPDDIMNENPELRITEFARKFFNNQKSLKKATPKQLLSFSSKPIKKPLLLSVNKSKTPKISSEAVDNFKNILSYIGEKGKKSAGDPEVAKKILTRGLQYPELWDEIYIQLLKQTQGRIEMTTLKRVWELLVLCCSTFPPSEDLENYLKNFVCLNIKNERVEISEFAQYCILKLFPISKARNSKKFSIPPDRTIQSINVAPYQQSRLFGITFEEILWYQKDWDPDLKIPKVIKFLCDQVKETGGMSTVGIFRIPGQNEEVNYAKDLLDRGSLEVKFSQPTTPASLLKQFFRELYESLIPEEFYDDCLKCAGKLDEEEKIIQKLRPINLAVLTYLIRYIREFSQQSVLSITKMGLPNLALVFAPNLLRCPPTTELKLTMNQPREQLFFLTLLKNLDCSKYEKML